MSMPNVRNVLKGWTKRQTAYVIRKQNVDFEVVELIENKPLRIMAVPMPPEKVMKKPEGQRSWKWFTVFTYSSLKLNTDDKIIADKTYLIMSKSDWSESGFLSYDCIETFTIVTTY